MVRFEDWTGQRKQKCKRGFSTRREALEWERTFQQQSAGDLDMTFEAFCKLYEKDMRPRLKESTWATILSHAVKHYGLKSNPASRVGCIGSKESEEMRFWTKDEYLRFSHAMMDKPLSYYAFEMLYWCGIREGELLALTLTDFDFGKCTVSISKSYQRLHGKDVITTPKTRKSCRTIRMPEFLRDEILDYVKSLYGIRKTDRLFPVTKNYLYHEMERGTKQTGVKRIRIHDLRHSHVSLLIDMGFSAVAIADRVGHESIDITYRYAHLFPTKQTEMADKLNQERSIEHDGKSA